MGFIFDMGKTGPSFTAVGKPNPKKKESHVRLVPPNVFFCLHCGERYDMATPVSLGIMAAIGKAFDKDHKKCRLDKVRGVACTYCFKFGHPMANCPLYKGDPEAWLNGPDVGMSSRALCLVIMGRLDPALVRHVPHDTQDFGRCYRLLKAMGWEDRVNAMANAPGWGGLVSAWAELTQLYEEELPSGVCPRLYERMQAVSVSSDTHRPIHHVWPTPRQ
jgi:hypothetical protein